MSELSNIQQEMVGLDFEFEIEKDKAQVVSNSPIRLAVLFAELTALACRTRGGLTDSLTALDDDFRPAFNTYFQDLARRFLTHTEKITERH